MTIASRRGQWQELRAHHGTWGALGWLARRAISRSLRVSVDHVQTFVASADDLRAPPQPPPPLRVALLTSDDVSRLSVDPQYDLDPSFADRLRDGRHQGVALFLGERLACYIWFARGSIEAEHSGGHAMKFPRDTAYVYKAYTVPEFRGQRLRQNLYAHELYLMGQQGVTRYLALIDWANFASLRNSRRAGYRTVGRIVTFRWRPMCPTFVSPAVKRLGITIE